MAGTVYLAGIAKIQVGYENEFHDANALNTFYVYGTGVEGASEASLLAYATAVYDGLTGTAWTNAMYTGHSLSFCRAYDWSSDEGNLGEYTVNTAGTNDTAPVAAQTATLATFGVPLRYRGGHPRMYLPYGMAEYLQTPLAWTSEYVTDLQSAFNTWWGIVGSTEIGSEAVTPVLFRTRAMIEHVVQPPTYFTLGSGTIQTVPATIRRRLRRAGHRK